MKKLKLLKNVNKEILILGIVCLFLQSCEEHYIQQPKPCNGDYKASIATEVNGAFLPKNIEFISIIELKFEGSNLVETYLSDNKEIVYKDNKKFSLSKCRNQQNEEIRIIKDNDTLSFNTKYSLCDLLCVSKNEDSIFGWLVFKQKESKPFEIDFKRKQIVVADFLAKE